MILLLKVTLLFAAGWLVTLLLAGKSAAVRHFVWALTLTGSLALALAAPLAPLVPVRVAAWPAALVPEPVSVAKPIAPMPSAIQVAPGGPIVSRLSNGSVETGWTAGIFEGRSPGFLLSVLWLFGAAIVASWYGLGHFRISRLTRGAVAIANPEWHASLRAVAATSGVSVPVRLFRTSAVGSPLTWGAFRPVVLLPESAESWPAERQRVVLAHELAHAVRGDYLSQLVACVTCSLYWFHPLAWAAARRLRVESERAADDHVLLRGVAGVDYAAHLLDVASQSRTMRLGGAVAIGMARPSHLEGRLLAVLDPACPRAVPAPRAQRAGWAGLALFVLPLAVLTPAAGRSLVPRTESLLVVGAVQDSTFQRSVEANPGGRLDLDLESGGSVDIRGWDRPMVQVRGRLTGDNWTDSRVTVEPNAEGVRLHAWQEVRRRSWHTSHSFEIMVPRRYDVHLKSAGGGLTLVDVEGSFDGETGGGELVLEHTKGVARLETGGGDIRVTDSDLRGRVNTGGGTVVLSRVRGGLNGTSGSGPLIYTDGGRGDVGGVRVDRDGNTVVDSRRADSKGVTTVGMLHIEKAGGGISLDAAPDGADVSTGGGDVRVGRSAGFVKASTGGGDVTVGPVAGSVEASTGAGTVHVWISEAGNRHRLVEVFSGHGSVVLELPAGLSARFELETAYTEGNSKGRIDSEWTLSQDETDRWDDSEGSPRKYVRATGTVGSGGPVIKVKTVNGNITVRRRAP